MINLKKMNQQMAIILLGAVVIAAVVFAAVSNQKNQEEAPETGINNNKEIKKSASVEIDDADNISRAAPALNSEYQKIMKATIKTSLGEIKVELSGDKTPITAGNFAKLAEAGFYDGVKFHRVISGFMIQGGDPLTKDNAQKERWGTGGPGYKFNDEPFEGQYSRGTIAMANSGPNTNGSQFFIMHQDYPLPPQYVIFGKVLEGMETVDAIAALETDARDCPLNPPVIESIEINR